MSAHITSHRGEFDLRHPATHKSNWLHARSHTFFFSAGLRQDFVIDARAKEVFNHDFEINSWDDTRLFCNRKASRPATPKKDAPILPDETEVSEHARTLSSEDLLRRRQERFGQEAPSDEASATAAQVEGRNANKSPQNKSPRASVKENANRPSEGPARAPSIADSERRPARTLTIRSASSGDNTSSQKESAPSKHDRRPSLSHHDQLPASVPKATLHMQERQQRPSESFAPDVAKSPLSSQHPAAAPVKPKDSSRAEDSHQQSETRAKRVDAEIPVVLPKEQKLATSLRSEMIDEPAQLEAIKIPTESGEVKLALSIRSQGTFVKVEEDAAVDGVKLSQSLREPQAQNVVPEPVVEKAPRTLKIRQSAPEEGTQVNPETVPDSVPPSSTPPPLVKRKSSSSTLQTEKRVKVDAYPEPASSLRVVLPKGNIEPPSLRVVMPKARPKSVAELLHRAQSSSSLPAPVSASNENSPGRTKANGQSSAVTTVQPATAVASAQLALATAKESSEGFLEQSTQPVLKRSIASPVELRVGLSAEPVAIDSTMQPAGRTLITPVDSPAPMDSSEESDILNINANEYVLPNELLEYLDLCNEAADNVVLQKYALEEMHALLWRLPDFGSLMGRHTTGVKIWFKKQRMRCMQQASTERAQQWKVLSERYASFMSALA
ncbi:hypothetical protein BCR37DRAFT_16879 [Protomyces lactucae-debilis]|uniref:Uncharacterized protein n=1 Tax=Protomyces lactucae-debilis TaxID=2754530 RepID=A0A1Y2FVA2_PROLT|nr:uncharacterized protein BCR37DRAFT_16879 [Protomyces lactucae-debilis]ORY87922.1 hypothetical protein BCR37DRAFT_16879 [Protomyces lactucae-debilis]